MRVGPDLPVSEECFSEFMLRFIGIALTVVAGFMTAASSIKDASAVAVIGIGLMLYSRLSYIARQVAK
jgi:hypothetical protein